MVLAQLVLDVDCAHNLKNVENPALDQNLNTHTKKEIILPANRKSGESLCLHKVGQFSSGDL